MVASPEGSEDGEGKIHVLHQASPSLVILIHKGPRSVAVILYHQRPLECGSDTLSKEAGSE